MAAFVAKYLIDRKRRLALIKDKNKSQEKKKRKKVKNMLFSHVLVERRSRHGIFRTVMEIAKNSFSKVEL